MFGFGGSGETTPKGDIFDIDEIRQLVLDFPPPSGSADDVNGLIPLASGEGYTTRDALEKTYASLIKNQYGKIPIEALEKRLDVDQNVLCNVLRSQESFMISKRKDYIFTTCDQERILQEICARIQSKFVHANEIAEQHDIDVQSMVKLVNLSEKVCESPMQLMDAPGQSRAKSLELGNSYVHTLATLLAMRNDVIERSKNAHTAARVAEWDTKEMFGLDMSTFAMLAHKLVQECNGPEPIYGYFEVGKDQVKYVTKNYLLRKAKHTLKEVALGEEAFCDLEHLVRKYPTLLPDVEAARQMALTQVLHKDGSRYKWHFITHYAIGDVGLNNTSKRCMETLGMQRYLDFRPFVQAFPSTIHRDVLMLLQNRTVEFWRYIGAAVKSAMGIEEWLIVKTIISDIEFATRRIARGCADDAYKRQVAEPSLSDEKARESFLQKLHEESDLPLELLLRLWDDERVKIKCLGTASFDERLAELKAEQQNQLQTTWTTRVYFPAQIHTAAVEGLEASPLKEQLRDLLQVHLVQDLIPSTLKRFRTKGLLREQSAVKQTEKLEAALASPKKDLPITKSIEKYHEKMGFVSPSPDDVEQARKQQLASMVKSMADDTDAPRLFLTTVIVLLALTQGSGVVYGTGKFAPRLLKLLKPQTTANQYASLERLKDAVKAASVTDEDRVEMRRIAADALSVSTAADEAEDTPKVPEE